MKENTLIKAIKFFITYMVTVFILDKIIPGEGLTVRNHFITGLMASTVYFLIMAKRDKKENEKNKE